MKNTKNMIKSFITSIGKLTFFNITQMVVYILIWILFCLSSMFMSVLFWSPNLKIDTDSPILIDITSMLNDLTGLIFALLIVGCELYKINDSLSILRLRTHHVEYKSTRKLSRIFLIMSLVASVSFLVLLKSAKQGATPIENIVDTLIDLVTNFKIRTFLIIVLSSGVSYLVEVGILEIPKKLKIIFVGGTLKSQAVITNKSGVIKKVINFLKVVFILWRGEEKFLEFQERYNEAKSTSKKSYKNKKLDNSHVKNKNESYKENEEGEKSKSEVKKEDGKVIQMDKINKDKSNKNNVDINTLKKVIDYLREKKKDESEYKIVVKQLYAACGIDKNVWANVRAKLYIDGYVRFNESGRITYFTDIKNKKSKSIF